MITFSCSNQHCILIKFINPIYIYHNGCLGKVFLTFVYLFLPGEGGALEESYRTQLSKLEEKIILLETEKAEMELNFLNQKAELEQNFRIERAEFEQRASSTSREADRSVVIQQKPQIIIVPVERSLSVLSLYSSK